MRRRIFPVFLAVAVFAVAVCVAQEVHVPASAIAGEEATISTTGSGGATFYLIGPGTSKKTDINLGKEIHLTAQDLRNAGNYLAIACADSCHSAGFYVVAAKLETLTFLVHPSRVPVGLSDAISGVAIPFDQFHNQVFTPVSVNFQLAIKDSSIMSREVRTQDGIAWFRASSGKSAGTLQVVASMANLSARRAVQQVASDPCNLRIKGQRTPKGIVVETDPVRDCSGNPVPDGTIVTFTASEAKGKSTVDAPIKQGVARAQMEADGPAVISAASGIVMGNELHIGGRP